MQKILTILFLTTLLTRCNIGAGTLGSFNERKLPVNKSDFLNALNSLTERQIPDKWKETALSIEDTYDFLTADVTCLYLKDNPEEMYFVSYQGNKKVTVISIRSVYKNEQWFGKGNLESKEIDRIEKRFDNQIIRIIEEKVNRKAE